MGVEYAVEYWKKQLVDTTTKNPLLYFRATPTSSLLGDAAGVNDKTWEALTASENVPLSDLFDVTPTTDATIRKIVKQASANNDDKGIRTLFLCFGLVKWVSAEQTEYAAPLLLQQVDVAAVAAATPWQVTSTSEVEVNPMLGQVLVELYGVSLPNVISQSALRQPLTAAERRTIHRRVVAACALADGVVVDDVVALANFSYEKSALVKDLDEAFEMGLVTSNRFVRALAGDEDAIMAVASQRPVVDPAEFDLRHPSKENLVLDADSTQSAAVEAVLGGHDVIIDGPPGTGKSQTIANLIAALAIEGKKVLFVAEKRAAIEAVTKRLDAVGLGDVVLDLHEGVRSRRDLYRQIEETLINNGRVLRPETTKVDDELHFARRELLGYESSLHDKRQPWNVSVYDCYNTLSEKQTRSKTLLSSESLFLLSGRRLTEAKETLRQFVSLDGLLLEQGGTTPWTSAYRLGHITTAEIASRTLETLQSYRYHTLEETLRVFQTATAETKLPPAETFAGWRKHFEMWGRATQVFDVFASDAYAHDIEKLLDDLEAATTAKARSRLSRTKNDGYKRALDAVKAVMVVDVPDPEVHQCLSDAVLLLHDWRIVARNTSTPSLPTVDLPVLHAVYAELLDSTERLERWVGADGWTTTPIRSLLGWVEALLRSSSTLYRLPEVVAARRKLHDFGLDDLVAEAAKRRLDLRETLDVFEGVWAQSVLNRVFSSDATLSGFSRDAHEDTVRRFIDADRTHIQLGAAKVRRVIAERAHLSLEANPQHATFIRQQARLRRGQMPPRAFLSKVANLVSTVKPCWAVSPLMVAQLIPRRQLFDVVIFDEASQVTPAEAVGAILRSKQVVVAGDPKQLPPTTFFSASDTHEFHDNDDDSFFVPNSESILDSASALLHNSTFTLSWHYRSRDEKLIAFSNSQKELYDWKLVTFPPAADDAPLRHVVVDDTADDQTPQEREIEVVVDEVRRHVRDHPERSLGVIAMGVKQAELIDDAIHDAQKRDDELARWLTTTPDDTPNEEFFVKNLERVQGDERDAIILSVGYGRNPDGGMVYRFGPLNAEGGERRLNVAVTRARQTMTVVSTFTAADLQPSKLKSDGMVMLRDYLAYVSSAGEELGLRAPAKPPLTPFEQDVKAALEQHGLRVEARYGASSPWVDLAVRDTDDRMVLAVECDNANVPGTLRDTRRLRPENLRRLGWGHYRIWAPHWLTNRDDELRRLLDAYTVAKTNGAPAPTAAPHPPVFVSVAVDPSSKTLPFPIAATKIGANIQSYSKVELVELMRWIESDGLLRTEADMVREAAKILKFERRGPAITKALMAAAQTSRYRVDTTTH